MTRAAFFDVDKTLLPGSSLYLFARGLYRRGRTTMHVSPGLGTTFVPFRFFARPEVTELVLESA